MGVKPNPAKIRTIEQLRSGTLGGTVALNIPAAIRSQVDRIYGDAVQELEKLKFWHDGGVAYDPRSILLS